MKSRISVLVSLCFFLFIANTQHTNAQSNDDTKQLPDLEIKLHNGESLKLNDLKGKVVLLDFWHRGCAPCLQAMPDLIALQNEFKDDLVIIGINRYDIKEDVVDYLNYKKVNYTSTYKTDNNITGIFNVRIYPTTILYDTQGNLIKRDEGYRKGGSDSLRRAIKKALK